MTDNAQPHVVHVNDVTKSFVVRKDNTLKDRFLQIGRGGRQTENFVAVDGVQISIEAGTTVALMGPNGSGKSTLLKLIGGILSPDEGTIQTRGRIAALLELGAGFHPDLSGRENVYLNASLMGLSRSETEAQFDAIVAFSGIRDFIDTQVKFYSSGMFVRLAFSVAVHTDPDILIVDEVLAVGDEAFQRKCMDRIRGFQAEGRTIILVTHSAAQVAELCDRGIVLDSGKVVFDGEANPAIAALRDILEGRRVGEIVEADVEAGPEIQVTRIEVLDGKEQPLGVVLQGDPLVLRVHVKTTRAFPEWATGFSIDTPMGQMVLASNTARLETELRGIPAGASYMDYRIEAAHFGAGQYSVNANASEIIDINTHVLYQGARFTVVGHEENFGTVQASITATS